MTDAPPNKKQRKPPVRGSEDSPAKRKARAAEAARRRREEERKRRVKQQRLLILAMIFTLLAFGAGIFIWKGFHSKKTSLRKEGDAAYKAGRYEEAYDLFQQSLQEKQWFSETMDLDSRMYMAASLFHLERYQEAGQLYREILDREHAKKDEPWINSMIRLADAMQSIEEDSTDLAELIPVLEETVAAGEAELSLFLGAAYLSAGDEAGMRQAFLTYTEHYSINTYVAYQLSCYDLEQGNLDQAAQEISEGLAAGDDLYRDLLRYNEVVLMEKQDPLDYSGALSKMEELLNDYPDRELFRQEYDFLYNRVHVDPTPVYTEE